MDINHGLAFLGQMEVYAGDYSDCADCDVIVITAGLGRKPGETRLDLANKNVPIAKDIITEVMKYYNGGVILVVSNPLDIMTYMIQKWSGLENGRVFGTGTTLDSLRFRYLLSRKFDVDVHNIHGYIIGEHGDSQFPVWSKTTIVGTSIDEILIPGTGAFLSEEEKAFIARETSTAGAQTIKNKGATYYSIAVVICSLLETILKNLKTIRTVSTIINNWKYGIDDVALSLPAIVGANGAEKIFDVSLNDKEIELLQNSAAQIKAFLENFKHML